MSELRTYTKTVWGCYDCPECPRGMWLRSHNVLCRALNMRIPDVYAAIPSLCPLPKVTT